MITLTRIVMLVGSRNLDADEEAFGRVTADINTGLQEKFGGKIAVSAAPYQRGSFTVTVTAPDTASAEKLFAKLVEHFSETREDELQRMLLHAPVTHLNIYVYVLQFLKDNPGRSYSAEDIAEVLSTTKRKVYPVLSKLRDEGKVVSAKGPPKATPGQRKMVFRVIS